MVEVAPSYTEQDEFPAGCQADLINEATGRAVKDMLAKHATPTDAAMPRVCNNGSRTNGILKSSSIVLGKAIGAASPRRAGGR